MKIGFIKSTPHLSSASGVRVQALTWKRGLENIGYEVDLINIWEEVRWESYQAIILFEYGGILKEWVELLKRTNVKLLLAPIIDTNYSVRSFYIASHFLGSNKLKISSKFFDLQSIKNSIDAFLIRSEYEQYFLTKGLGIAKNKTHIIPLSYRLLNNTDLCQKEDFCLHVSRLASKNKNVERLIEAAKKYNFNLVLAGTLNGHKENEWLYSLIKDSNNIKYVGRLSDEELQSYYSRAKVFALPSTFEGVGLVALEAALFHCEIVITKYGGPKEYFANRSYLVDPYDIDQIGTAVMSFLNNKISFQPELSSYIKCEYSLEKTIQVLNVVLENIL